MSCSGLIYDDSRHYIDHLAPFCALKKWPLIVCESEVGELAKKYYPDLEVVLKNPLQLPSTIVSCDTAPLIQAAFPHQTTQVLWLPHGNSDKGWNSPLFEALKDQKTAFVYGQKMIDFMQAKNVFPKTIKIGNFRWEYFQKHRDFYQNEVNKILPSSDQNILYAPTWDDFENNNSFWKAFPHLIEALPNHMNLLIKLHPNTLRKYEIELEILQGRMSKSNVIFLPEFPPIYPILDSCIAYIGDMSSIGYDFLTFNRPLFFLNANPALPLHQCGTAIESKTFKFELCDHHSEARKKLYEYTFIL